MEVNKRMRKADGNERALEKLVKHGFGRRTVKDAKEYPKGYTSTVIKYGTVETLKIMRERKKERMRKLRGYV